MTCKFNPELKQITVRHLKRGLAVLENLNMLSFICVGLHVLSELINTGNSVYGFSTCNHFICFQRAKN